MLGLSIKKNNAESYVAKRLVEDLAREAPSYTTGLIKHKEKIYRVTINGGINTYKVEEIAKISELPVKD
jgi:hypothetical protein